MCGERVHDGVQEFRPERRRIGELRLGVVRRLESQFLRLEELPLEDADVSEFIAVRQFAIGQPLHAQLGLHYRRISKTHR